MLTAIPSLVGVARTPWNKGRLIGQLPLERRQRDLALFNLAIDSKLRGCDRVRLRVNDVCIGAQLRDRSHGDPVKNRKAGPVRDYRTDTMGDPRLARLLCASERALSFPEPLSRPTTPYDPSVRSYRPPLG